MNPINFQREENFKMLLEKKRKEKSLSKNDNTLVNQFTTLKIEPKTSQESSKQIENIELKGRDNPRNEKLEKREINRNFSKKREKNSLDSSLKGSNTNFSLTNNKNSNLKENFALKRSFEEFEGFGSVLSADNKYENNIVDANLMKRFKQNDYDKTILNRGVGLLEQQTRDTLWFLLILNTLDYIYFYQFFPLLILLGET